MKAVIGSKQWIAGKNAEEAKEQRKLMDRGLPPLKNGKSQGEPMSNTFYQEKHTQALARREAEQAEALHELADDQQVFDDWAASAPVSPGFRRGGGSTALQLFTETYRAHALATKPPHNAVDAAAVELKLRQEALHSWRELPKPDKEVWVRRLETVQTNYAAEKAARAQERASGAGRSSPGKRPQSAPRSQRPRPQSAPARRPRYAAAAAAALEPERPATASAAFELNEFGSAIPLSAIPVRSSSPMGKGKGEGEGEGEGRHTAVRRFSDAEEEEELVAVAEEEGDRQDAAAINALGVSYV
jgi:hypothetical protein